MGEKMV